MEGTEPGELYWIQRLEDGVHAWCKRHGSPVLLRVRFDVAPDRAARLLLCAAGAFNPVAARLDVADWDAADQSFVARLLHIRIPSITASAPPPRASIQPRASFGAPMR